MTFATGRPVRRATFGRRSWVAPLSLALNFFSSRIVASTFVCVLLTIIEPPAMPRMMLRLRRGPDGNIQLVFLSVVVTPSSRNLVVARAGEESDDAAHR